MRTGWKAAGWSAKAFMLVGGLAGPAALAEPAMVLQFGPARVQALAVGGGRVVSSEDGLIKVWDLRTGELWRDLRVGSDTEGSPVDAEPLALSRDGATVAYAPAGGRVELWDARTGRRLRTLEPPAGSVYKLLWTPDGRTFAVSGPRETRMWDAATWKRKRSLPAGGAVAFSADGRWAATAAMRTTEGPASASVWDLTTRERRCVLKDGSAVYGPVAFSPDGRLVVTVGEDPEWKGPDLAPGQDAPTEASHAHDGKVKVWDARTGKRLRLLPGHFWSAGTTLLGFTADGTGVISSGTGRTELWDWRTGKSRWRIGGDLGGAAALSADRQALAYVTDPNRVVVRSVHTAKRLWITPPTPALVDALAISPSGDQLVATEQRGPRPGTLRVWNIREGRLARPLPLSSGDTYHLGFLDDGRTLLRNAGGLVQLWNIASGRQRDSLNWLEPPSRMLLSPDGRTLVVATPPPGWRFEVRDAASKQLRTTIDGWNRSFDRAAFSPTGRRIANMVGSREFSIGVWDLNTGRQENSFPVRGSYPQLLTFSPDGKRLAAFCPRPLESSEERRPWRSHWDVRLWDLETGRLVWVSEMASRVEALAFRPGGDLLAVGGAERITLLDTQTGRQLRSLLHEASEVRSLAFSPDGQRLASGGGDGRIRIWEPDSGRLRATLMGLPPEREGTVSKEWIVLTPEGSYDASPGAARFIRWRFGERLLPAAAFAGRYQRPEQVRRALSQE